MIHHNRGQLTFRTPDSSWPFLTLPDHDRDTSTGMSIRVGFAPATARHKRKDMKAPWLTVPELAAVLKLSVVSVRRAYWKGHLPVIRIGRMVRFDLDQVRAAIQWNGHGQMLTVDTHGGPGRRAPGGASRRRDGPPSPRLVKRGRKFQPRSRRSV